MHAYFRSLTKKKTTTNQTKKKNRELPEERETIWYDLPFVLFWFYSSVNSLVHYVFALPALKWSNILIDVVWQWQIKPMSEVSGTVLSKGCWHPSWHHSASAQYWMASSRMAVSLLWCSPISQLCKNMQVSFLGCPATFSRFLSQGLLSAPRQGLKQMAMSWRVAFDKWDMLRSSCLFHWWDKLDLCPGCSEKVILCVVFSQAESLSLALAVVTSGLRHNDALAPVCIEWSPLGSGNGIFVAAQKGWIGEGSFPSSCVQGGVEAAWNVDGSWDLEHKDRGTGWEACCATLIMWAFWEERWSWSRVRCPHCI